MLYLVTGATGFLGNVVVKMLRERGEAVRGFARNKAKCREIYQDDAPELVFGDVRDYESLSRLFDGIEDDFVVIHTAAVVSIGGAKEAKTMREVNVRGTEHVLRLCRERGAKRLIFVSSVHAIPERGTEGTIAETNTFDARTVIGGYAETKAICSEKVSEAAREGLDAVIVHPSAILGPGDYGVTFLSQMMIDYANGRIPASVRGGFDFVDVRDVASGILRACAAGRRGECYLLTGHRRTITDVMSAVAEETGRKKPATLPMWTAKAGLPFLWTYSKLFGKRPLYTRYALYTLGSNCNFSHEKATAELGFAPRPTEETVRDAVAFFRARGWIEV